MLAPFPTYAPANSATRSPRTAPSSTTANGPTETSFPREAPGWTTDCGEIPGAGRTGGWNCSTAHAKAKYGFGARRKEQGTPGMGSLAMTADAFVPRASCAYFGLERNVTCPGPASSSEAMPLTSASGPDRTAPIFPASAERKMLLPTASLLLLRRGLRRLVHEIEDPPGDVEGI